MRQKAASIFAIAMLTLAGCQTVHATHEGAVPVAIWSSLILIDQQGRPAKPEARDIVSQALTEAGLHPVCDDGGVSVPDSEETRAREVLLTDKRLVDTEAIVLLAIPAGTGRRTAAGFVVPAVAPRETMRLGTTTPGK